MKIWLHTFKIHVVWNDAKVYRAHSRSLKRLRLSRTSCLRFDSVPGVIIDAPQLCCLRIVDILSKSFIVNNLKFNAKLDISLNLGLEGSEASVSSGRSHIRSFLSEISKVEGYYYVCEHFQGHSSLFQIRTASSI